MRTPKITARALILATLLSTGCSDDAVSDGSGAGNEGGTGDGAGSSNGGQAAGGGDTTAPTVAWITPTEGAQLAGHVTLALTASDDSGTATVEIRLDTATGAVIGAASADGDAYTLTWDSVGAANGPHTLVAVASDAAGNKGEASLGVTLQNEFGPPTGGLSAVATFESLGLYMPAPANLGSAPVKYRAVGEASFRDALPLWRDDRDDELRGSVLGLTPGLAWEIRVEDGNGNAIASGTFGTWADSFPIEASQTVTLNGMSDQPIEITESGTPAGYVLYTGAPGAGIDMGFAADNNPEPCIRVSGSYVIVRALTLKHCQDSAVEIMPGAHDVVIEGNDISGFGAGFGGAIEGDTASINTGYAETAAIACTGYDLPDNQKPSRIIVQGNKIHDPRYGSNPWKYGHPYGTNGIGFFECGGNHVIRYNDVLGSHGHYFMDGIGGSDNFTSTGFPNNDSDIYGNWIAKAYDDGIEAEGGNRQVRVYDNYITQSFIGIANGTVTRGPIYVVRNITSAHAGMWDPDEQNPDAESERGLFFKLGSQDPAMAGGKAYYFHNTALQPDCPAATGASLTCGIDSGMQNSAGNVQATNIESANNIFVNYKSGHSAIGWQMDDGSGTFEHDMFIGTLDVTEIGGIEAYPVFAADVDEGLTLHTHSGSGDMVATRSYDASRTPNEIGDFSLASGSPGRGAAKKLPNINDQYASPDVGAHQAGTPNKKFGTALWTGAKAW